MTEPWDEEQGRQEAWDRRITYAERTARLRPARGPAPRNEQDEAAFAMWLWAMAQPLRDLDRKQVDQFAEWFDLTVLERAVGPTIQIFGEAYSAPGSIAVQYDDVLRDAGPKPRGVVVRVAVEGVWPNE